MFLSISEYSRVSLHQHHLLDLVQVVGPPVIYIMKEASSDHGHYLQVSVVSLQHSRLSTQKHRNRSKTKKIYTIFNLVLVWKNKSDTVNSVNMVCPTLKP